MAFKKERTKNAPRHATTHERGAFGNGKSNASCVQKESEQYFVGSHTVGNHAYRMTENQKQTKRIRPSSVLLILLFLLGLCVLLYPLISEQWNSWRQAQLVSEYDIQMASISDEESARWLTQAEAYNKTLVGKGIPDAFAYIPVEEDQYYREQLAFREDGMMGTLTIPRISVNLPIYHTASEESLEKGVGHLQGSALPVGGLGTHSVLSAHRGLPSSVLFTDLDQLKEGDHFYIRVLNRNLAYEVDQIKTVEPTRTEDLNVDQNQDYVTLVTCTPYGINSHRLLVRGHSVPYDADVFAQEVGNSTSSIFGNYWLWVVAGLLLVALIAWLAYKLGKKKRNNPSA